MNKKISLLACAVLLSAANANAGFYAGATLGYGENEPDAVEINYGVMSMFDMKYEMKPKVEKSASFGLHAGYELPAIIPVPLRVEGEYLYQKADVTEVSMAGYIDDVPTGAPTVDDDPNAELTNTSFMVNAYVGIPGVPVVKPYVGLGVGMAQTDIEITDDTDPTQSFKIEGEWGLSYQFMLGAEYTLPAIPLSFSAEYRYTTYESNPDAKKLIMEMSDMTEAEYEAALLAETIQNPDSTMEATVSSLVFKARYSF